MSRELKNWLMVWGEKIIHLVSKGSVERNRSYFPTVVSMCPLKIHVLETNSQSQIGEPTWEDFSDFIKERKMQASTRALSCLEIPSVVL